MRELNSDELELVYGGDDHGEQLVDSLKQAGTVLKLSAEWLADKIRDRYS